MTKKLQPFFWLAILAHLLMFLSFSFSLFYQEPLQPFEKKSDNYVPAYLYQKEKTPIETAETPAQSAAAAQTAPEPPPPDTTADIALKKQKMPQTKQQPQETATTQSAPQPQAHGSSAFIEAESPLQGKPIDEPLLKELSRATAAKLFYPPEAAAYNLKGTATISFLLYPDGRVTNVSLAKSSGFRILDEAALSTIRAISPVRDANLYLSKPKVLLAGIIFG